MRPEVRVLLLAASILFVAVAPGGPAGAQESARVRILFDLGDGAYAWSDVTISDPAAPNASWDATRAAAATHGLDLEWMRFDCCGVAVTDVGDRNPPAGFVALDVWNATAGVWEPADVGISGLVLRDGDAIAWYNAGFDSMTYEARHPVATPVHPRPWTAFRGDLANRGAAVSEAPNGATVLWDRDTGVTEIESTPAVAYGRVYVATRTGFLALDASTGAVRWTNPDVRGFSSPAVFDGTVIAASSDGRVYRLDAADGSERWNVTLLAQTGFSGITSSPKVWFDRVYVGTLNESGGPGEVVALWVGNGTVAWRHRTGSIHFSSPAIADGTVYVGVMGRYNTTTQITFDPPYGVLALDALDGTERWFFPTGGPVAASPLIRGTEVFAVARDGSVHSIDAVSGAELWRKGVGPSVSSPALDGDTLYVAGGLLGGSSYVHALDALTGGVRWTFTPNGPVQASVAYADGKAFLSTNAPRGTVYALNASSGDPVWAFTPTPEEYIFASPVVSNGTVYAPSDNGHVYALRDAGDSLAALEAVGAVSTPHPQGSAADVTFAVRAVAGRLTDVRLSAILPDALTLESAIPAATRREGNALEWDLGAIGFGFVEEVTLRVGVGSPPGGQTDASVPAVLTYADNDGTAYPSLAASFPLAVAGTPGDRILWIGVGIAIAAVGAAVVVAWRRRRARP